MTKPQLIVLDRDGVINADSDNYIKSAEEWIPLEGSLEAIARLKKAGWIVAIATNQSGIARGYYDRATLSQMHQKMQNMLKDLGAQVDWIAYSPYVSDDQAWCRKPGPGMLHAIERRFGLSLEGIPFVGDTWSDMQAALFMRMDPYFVKTGKGEGILQSHSKDLQANAISVFDNLAQVVDHILL